MKRSYEIPEMEIVTMIPGDVITSSSILTPGGDFDDEETTTSA